MNIKLKIALTISIICLSFKVQSQKAYTPFTGSAFIASGISTVIDFKRNNDGMRIPFQIGLRTQKYFSNDIFFEFGFIYSQRGTHKIEFTEFQGGSSQDHYSIRMNCIDLPLVLGIENSLLKKRQSYYKLGFTNSVLIIPPTIFVSDDEELSDDVFRRYYGSALIGIEFSISEQFGITLFTNIPMFSIVKTSKISDFEEHIQYFGSHLYPIELIIGASYNLSQ